MRKPSGPTHRRRRLVAAALVLLVPSAAILVGVSLIKRRAAHPAAPTLGFRALVTTFAGDGAPGSLDATPALQARFEDPFGVAVDSAGNVYVADAGASNRIRKIDPGGAVTTLAGGAEGYADGAGASASFNTPSGLAADAAGNLYVADTANHRVRKVTPQGVVSTLAGDGTPGHRDGPAAAARFDAPVGVAVSADGSVYVADTYNDRIRLITPAGEVRTLASGERPGYADGAALGGALFDTPCGVALGTDGALYVADTGNDRLRRVGRDGQVTTVGLYTAEGAELRVGRPVGLLATPDGSLYFTTQGGGRVWQLGPDGRTRPVAGTLSGFADGDGQTQARFNQPAGLAMDSTGALYVADSANYLVRKLTRSDGQAAGGDAATTPAQSQPPATHATNASGVAPGEAAPVEVPRLSAATLGHAELPWPLDPTNRRHEVTATMGEVRGSFDGGDARHHLHSGIDIFGADGSVVRAVRDEKVASPLPNWAFGALNEGLRVGLFSYVHIRVGRGKDDKPFDDARFRAVREDEGKLARVRVRRGARFRAGDALGTVNRFYHVHLNFGPPGNELNPLALPFADFADTRAPLVARDGVRLLDEAGRELERREGRPVLTGAARVVVEAYDQVDGNAARRRLGLYRLGYQLLNADGAPAPGFAEPRINLEFDRLPPQPEAVRLAYADESGITVYGSKETRFFYELTNTVSRGRAFAGRLDASQLPAGDYTLRVFASDFAGNVATADTLVRVAR